MNIRSVALAIVLGVFALAGVQGSAGAEAPQSVRIMTLGDSITAGTDGDGGYPAKLARRLGDRAEVFNYGRGGWTVRQMYPVVDGWLDAVQPDIVILSMGTNDAAQPDNPSNIAGRIFILVDQILNHPSHPKVLLGSIPVSARAGLAVWQNVANSYLQTIARYRPGRVWAFGFIIHPAWLTDGIHPSRHAYEVMAFQASDALEPLMGDLTIRPSNLQDRSNLTGLA